MTTLINSNPTIHNTTIEKQEFNFDDSETEDLTPSEIFQLIRNINDPEHPLSLEQLNVIQSSLIDINSDTFVIKILFTPTIPHCSMVL